jgi:hypothetical protein
MIPFANSICCGFLAVVVKYFCYYPVISVKRLHQLLLHHYQGEIGKETMIASDCSQNTDLGRDLLCMQTTSADIVSVLRDAKM